MATPILYTFRRCPFAIRARAALYFSTTKVEIREVVLKNKPIDMLKASKKGTVPILVLKNKVLDESIEIIIWALKNYDALNLLNPYEKDKKNTLNIISKIDNEFKYHLDRYKYSSRFKEDIDFKGKYLVPFMVRKDNEGLVFPQKMKYSISELGIDLDHIHEMYVKKERGGIELMKRSTNQINFEKAVDEIKADGGTYSILHKGKGDRPRMNISICKELSQNSPIGG